MREEVVWSNKDTIGALHKRTEVISSLDINHRLLPSYVFSEDGDRIPPFIMKVFGGTGGGARGDKATWFWSEEVQVEVRKKKEAYKQWQKSKAPEHLAVCRKLKRLAKAAAAKAKNEEMDALYEKLDGPQGEKFAIRLAKARRRACIAIRVVKAVKSADARNGLSSPSRDDAFCSVLQAAHENRQQVRGVTKNVEQNLPV
ncbi:unnamed protein product [Heligmosomoides polygyrus]|uniref:Remorin_C domain-containing protein n=1 Tax=Heligmosomoides polygyrus TaxID=6339 RepID=A0A183F3U1_HELPZ|nr:unnamed protein product [Heligmosomoides polygyrus]